MHNAIETCSTYSTCVIDIIGERVDSSLTELFHNKLGRINLSLQSSIGKDKLWGKEGLPLGRYARAGVVGRIGNLKGYHLCRKLGSRFREAKRPRTPRLGRKQITLL